ncbi:hypothetical protein FIT69_04240 [Candidatus Methylopumilus planktonicus]|uniref:hypothetical protein n=1 Tax=Candidatus Methylopumilus planktonicus TaxID=1581557 RepID=UPI001121DEFE|nr:hypothetical protein [Candidatus Methylopumilus planktonicus]QDD01781.1 hypothetical protein FIT69_04240 [Candidatus Methylopumilus planktonicus]
MLNSIYVDREMYLDGSNFFTGMLSKTTQWPYWNDDWHNRIFVNYLNQFFMVLGIKVGVTSLKSLKYLYGFGLFFTSFFIYMYCFLVSKRASNYIFFFLAIANLITCVIPSNIYILNQAITTLSLNWLLLHYIYLGADIKINKIDFFVIFFTLLVLFRSHESQLIWSAFIAATYFVSFLKISIKKTSQSILIHKIIFIASLMHFIFNIYWKKSHPYDQATNAMFSNIQYLFNFGELSKGNTMLAMLTVFSLFTVLIIGYIHRNHKSHKFESFRSSFLIYSFFAIFYAISFYSLYYSISIFTNLSGIDPFREFLYRFIIPFGSIFFMALATFFWLKGVSLSSLEKNMFIFSLSVGLISSSLWQIGNNINWKNFQSYTYRTLIESKNFLVDPSEVQKNLSLHNMEYLYKYRCNWSWPVYGLAIQDEKNIKKLFLPQDGFQDWFAVSTTHPSYVKLPFVTFYNGSFFNFNSIIEKCSILGCKID